MSETPSERYWRRRNEEIDKPTAEFKEQIKAKCAEITAELEAVQGKCNPCVDDGGMFEGFCKLCGASFG